MPQAIFAKGRVLLGPSSQYASSLSSFYVKTQELNPQKCGCCCGCNDTRLVLSVRKKLPTLRLGCGLKIGKYFPSLSRRVVVDCNHPVYRTHLSACPILLKIPSINLIIIEKLCTALKVINVLLVPYLARNLKSRRKNTCFVIGQW